MAALRIVHVVRRFHPLHGGTERYVLDLARRQQADGHLVTVVTLDRDVIGTTAERWPSRDEVDGVRIQRLTGLGGPRWAVTTRPDLLVRSARRSDVLHLHDLRFHYGLLHLVAAARDRPLFLHTHGLVFHTSDLSGVKRAALRLFYGPIARRGRTVVVADSRADRDKLVAVVPSLAANITLVPNALDLRVPMMVERDPEAGRLFTFGRVTPSKGLRELVDALTLIRDLAWTLTIAGPVEGGEDRVLMERAERGGIGSRLSFLGPFSDETLVKELSRAHMTVFPSRGEGFGLALVEAMAAATPVIANDIDAHREVLGPGLEQCLVDFGDPMTAAVAIRGLLRDAGLGAEIARRARVRSSDFEVGRLWDDVQALYRRSGLDW